MDTTNKLKVNKQIIMARTNTKTVVKHYDTDTVNGWTLNYEYESQDGMLPAEIRVNGTKGASSLYISRSNNNVSFNFGGGSSFDMIVIGSVQSEFDAIIDSFSTDPETAE